MTDVILVWLTFAILMTVEAAALIYLAFFAKMRDGGDVFVTGVFILVLGLMLIGTGVAGWHEIMEAIRRIT